MSLHTPSQIPHLPPWGGGPRQLWHTKSQLAEDSNSRGSQTRRPWAVSCQLLLACEPAFICKQASRCLLPRTAALRKRRATSALAPCGLELLCHRRRRSQRSLDYYRKVRRSYELERGCLRARGVEKILHQVTAHIAPRGKPNTRLRWYGNTSRKTKIREQCQTLATKVKGPRPCNEICEQA